MGNQNWNRLPLARERAWTARGTLQARPTLVPQNDRENIDASDLGRRYKSECLCSENWINGSAAGDGAVHSLCSCLGHIFHHEEFTTGVSSGLETPRLRLYPEKVIE